MQVWGSEISDVIMGWSIFITFFVSAWLCWLDVQHFHVESLNCSYKGIPLKSNHVFSSELDYVWWLFVASIINKI